MNKRSQVNLLIIFGMFAMTLLAVTNLMYYTANTGLTSEIRRDVLEVGASSEISRGLLDQAVKYSVDRSILLAGIYPYTDLCGIMNKTEIMPFIPTLSTDPEISYWKNMENLCLPTDDQISDVLLQYMNQFGRVTYQSMGISEASITGEFFVDLTRIGNEYRGVLSEPYLNNDYDIIYEPDTFSISFAKQVPPRDSISTTPFEWFYLEDVHLRVLTPEYHVFYLTEICNGQFSGCTSIEGQEYRVMAELITSPVDHYVFDLHEGCDMDGTTCILGPQVTGADGLLLDDMIDNLVEPGDKYQVTEADNLTAQFFTLERYDKKKLYLMKDFIFYDPKNLNIHIPDLVIGEEPTDRGRMSITMIPTDNERFCTSREVIGFNLSYCDSIISDLTYYGGFTDLMAYARDYVNGKHENYFGWQEYFLDDQVRRKLDAVEMKTVKVFLGDETKPKQDWKTSLIWRFGLIDTPYEGQWDVVDSILCYIYDGQVEICECGEDETFCNQVLNDSMWAEFKRIFEQISPAVLKSVTNYDWAIKIKEMNVNVTDTCSGESFVTHYEQTFDFNATGEDMIVGLPTQFLFAENSSIHIKPEWDCKCNEDRNIIGTVCLSSGIGTSEAECGCTWNDDIDSFLTCTMDNYCCPPNATEILKNETHEITCCGLKETEDWNGRDFRYLTYECYPYDSTDVVEYNVTETRTDIFEDYFLRRYGGLRWEMMP